MSGVNCRRENFTLMRGGEGFDREGLGQAGHAFEQDVAVGEQADDQPLGQIILADDDLAEFVKQRVRKGTRFLDCFVDGVDSSIHFCDFTDRWTMNPASVFKEILDVAADVRRTRFYAKKLEPPYVGCYEIRNAVSPRQVLCDLGFQFFERTKFFLVAQLFADFDFQFLAVKVAGEIEQMRLDAELRASRSPPSGESRCSSGDAVAIFFRFWRDRHKRRWAAEPGPPRRDSRWENRVAGPAVARDHAAGNRVRPSEHLARGIQIAGANGFANARAADDLIVERHGGQSVNGETQFTAEFFKQRDIAAALVAKNKIRADAEALDFSEVARQAADERLAGLPAECSVEMNQQQRVRAERFDRAQFLRQRINQRRHAVGRDDGVGMPVERDHQRDGVVLARVGDGLADDLLMAEVDAVKKADGQADFAAAGLQFICGMDDFHVAQRAVGICRQTQIFCMAQGKQV